MRNLQEQVEKSFFYQKLFWPFKVWLNCSSDLKFFKFLAFSLKFQKFFSITNFFFLTVGQNNFGNKIPISKLYLTKIFSQIPVVPCEHRNQLYPAHRRGWGAQGGLGLKNHLHFGNGWLCCGPGQCLEIPKAGPREWWRGFPYSLLYHVAHWGKEFSRFFFFSPLRFDKIFMLVLLWVQKGFCRVTIVLYGSKSFWTGPNYKN